jgi:hypothetical protein
MCTRTRGRLSNAVFELPEHRCKHNFGGDGGYAFQHRKRAFEQHCCQHRGNQPERLRAVDGNERLRLYIGRRVQLLDLHYVRAGFGCQLLGDAVGG